MDMGNWKVTTWNNPTDSGIPSWLFGVGERLTAANSGRGPEEQCTLSWTDENNTACSMTLTGAIPGTASGLNVQVTGTDLTLESVKFTGNITDGLSGTLYLTVDMNPPGTIAATAEPGP